MEPWLLTLDLLRCKGLELELSFVLASVRLWNELHQYVFAGEGLCAFKIQSTVFFYKVDCPLFLPALQLFFLHLSFPVTSNSMRVFGLIGPMPLLMLFWSCLPRGAVLVGSHVCMSFRHGVRHLRFVSVSP